MALMGFQRRRYCEVRRRVPIEDVNEFRFLDRGDHDGASLWVGREVLAGDDPPCTRFAVCFLVELGEDVGFGVVFKDDDASRVRTDYGII